MAETASISHPVVYLLLLSTSLFLTGVMSGHTLENVCSAKERNSLLEFKAKLFDPNGILSSWTEEDNCCRWKGISCDESGVVVMVDLHNANATDPYDLDFYSFGLSGEIDSSLLSLRNLQHLDLSGFEILAFPCNQFGGQEPGDNEQILEFACTRFKAEYPIFDKVDVNGNNAAPLYKFLKSSKGGLFGSSIKWNFSKFLIDKEGNVVDRYAPTTSPFSIEKDIKKLLGVS